MPRASSLPLLTKCLGSDVLPHAPMDPKYAKNAKLGAVWGTMVHTWKETGNVVSSDKRSATALAKAIELSKVDRESLWPSEGHHETAIAVRVDGTREVRRSHDGIFGTPEWITGTGDFHWYIFGGELWVDDLKTGKVYPDEITGENRFPQDPRSAQLKCYALAIAVLIGYAGVVHVSVTHWPRLPIEHRHKEPSRLWTTFTTDELTDFWGELELLYRQTAESRRAVAGDDGSTLHLTPGDHCRFCPSKPYCLVAKPDPEPVKRSWTHF